MPLELSSKVYARGGCGSFMYCSQRTLALIYIGSFRLYLFDLDGGGPLVSEAGSRMTD